MAPTPSPTPPNSLQQALDFAPALPSTYFFTDWAAIRRHLGIEYISGATPVEQKIEALRAGLIGTIEPAQPASEASFAGFAVNHVASHFDDWAFDFMDLDWDLGFGSPGSAPGWALRFREGFDMAGLQAKLDGYGYSSQTLAHGVLRSLPREQFLRLLIDHRTDMAMSTIGFVDDGRTVVLGDAEVVTSLLTDGPTGLADPSARSVARLLGEPFSAALLTGTLDCQGYARTPAQLDMLARAGGLQTPNVVGVGYSRLHTPIGRFVLGYAEAAEAEVDLAARRLLATEGQTSDGRLYGDLFALVDARVAERAITLDVAPARDTPQQLVQLVVRRDLLLASCPG